MKKWHRIVLRWAVTLAVSVGTQAIGSLVGGRIPNAAAWQYAFVYVMLAAIILSPILSAVWSKKLEKAKVTELVILS